MIHFDLDSIAIVESPFKEKFGIPRQPGLVPAAEGILRMQSPYNQRSMLQGLEGFSHIWVSFIFHESLEKGWKEKVRPPRLGGNKEVGVFASRSPFRPNGLGLSVLQLVSIEDDDGGLALKVAGLDLLDKTPIVDIKPYVGYSDALLDTRSGFAPDAPLAVQEVVFSVQAQQALGGQLRADKTRLLIEQVLALDPRPAYKKSEDSDRVYGMRLDGLNVRWQVQGSKTTVVELLSDVVGT